MANVPVWNYLGHTQEKIDLVNTKYSDTMEFASSFYELVQGYLNDLNSLVDSIKGVDNTITVPPVDTDIDIGDLEALLREFPENPLDGLVWPDPPTDVVVFDEDVNYSDTLFNAFDIKLQNMLSDITTLINGTIENDILYRERERDILINQTAITAKASEWSERGFELPGGGLFTSVGQVDIEYQNTLLTKSRDIAVESRKIEIANAYKVMEEINKFEAVRMQYKSNYWQRKFEAAKSILDRGTQIFMGRIEVIKSQADTYKAVSDGYGAHAGALTEFAKAKYESIRGSLDYARLKVDALVASLGTQLREMEIKYNTSLGGIQAQANLAAHIMASALAGVSASVTMTTQDQTQFQNQTQASESWSHEE